MRIKDELKQEAIINATVKLVNEIGFVSSSVAKIAKEANVSPATLYIYYENKEDLLVSTYITIKKKLSEKMMDGFNENKPVRDILELFWINAYRFIIENPDFFQFAEQFANSPFSDLIRKPEIEKLFKPMYEILQRGINEKKIKNLHFEILGAFIFSPLMIITNNRHCSKIKMNEKTIRTAFELAWDAIRL